MKTLKQLFRQPLKFFSGILLLTLAVAVLCVCLGQSWAAKTTKQALDERFSTVAVPIVQENLDGSVSSELFCVEQELLDWLEKTAKENPDLVKTISRHGFLSAYIPELTPLNITTEKYLTETVSHNRYQYYAYQSSPDYMPYSCAMLVITLDKFHTEPVTQVYPVENLTQEHFYTEEEYQEWLADPETQKETRTLGYTVELIGTVTEVLSLGDGYRNPVGRIARLTMTVPNLEALEVYCFEKGNRYIVYGMDYVDEYWQFIGNINYDGRYDHVSLEPFNPELLRLLGEEKYISNLRDFWGQSSSKYVYASYNHIYISKAEYLQLNAISMTLDAAITHTAYEEIRDEETGTLLELRPVTQVTYTDWKGETVTLSNEEYASRYKIPNIVHLEGSVDDFLASTQGQLWQAALQRDQINNHAFAVVGVDKLGYLADFALENSQIVAGRDFTTEELAGGHRVCIINETLAQANGLEIGDTIDLNFYCTDYGLPYQDPNNLLNPSASFYFSTTPFAEVGEYTIVGFWRGQRVWPDVAKVSEYAFSPNTVFVPNSSVQTQMEKGNSVVFVSPILQNGKIEEFHNLAMLSGYAGRFRYYDQNFTAIAGNFHNYEDLARQIVRVGAAVYAILLILYLLLYPASQSKSVWTMSSLGVPFSRRCVTVLVSSLATVIPATLLGLLTGKLLWQYVVLALQTTVESTIALQLENGALETIALAQLALAFVLNLTVAIFVAVPRKLSARR